MSEPRTEAGKALLDGLADALGTTSDSALGAHGELFRERIHDAVVRGVFAIEAEATAAEHARAVDACAKLILAERSGIRVGAKP